MAQILASVVSHDRSCCLLMCTANIPVCFHGDWQADIHYPFLIRAAALKHSVCVSEEEERPKRVEKQRYDGWYNNLAHPEWGSVGESDGSCLTPPKENTFPKVKKKTWFGSYSWPASSNIISFSKNVCFISQSRLKRHPLLRCYWTQNPFDTESFLVRLSQKQILVASDWV